MPSYKDILCKNFKKEEAKVYNHQYYKYNPKEPVECFVCKQSFLELYHFRYYICPGEYENFIGWENVRRASFCIVCMNARMDEEEYKDQLDVFEAAEIAKRVACVECGEKVDPDDILMSRSDYDLLPVCMAKCYKKVYPYGIDRMDYELLFSKYDTSRGVDDSHQLEDEIYRRFICDVATGRFESPAKMMEMAKRVKSMIDDRANCCRWFA